MKTRVVAYDIKRLPFVALLAAVLILMGILGVITLESFSSSQNQMRNSLRTHGLTLIRAFEAGARTSMMGMMWSNNQIQTLIEETAKEENIDYIAIVDEDGNILAHNDRTKMGQIIVEMQLLGNDEGESYHKESVKTDSMGSKTYQLVAPFDPVNPRVNIMMNSMMHRNVEERWMKWCRMMSPIGQSTNQYIVLSLRMDEYDRARARDIKRGLATVGVLFVVGFAAFYFLLSYQSYTATNRALKDVKTFADNVVESMPNGLISLDKEGNIRIINHNALNMLELSQADVIGHNLSNAMERCNLNLTFIPGKDVYEERVDCRLNSGRIIPLSITSSQLKDEADKDIGRVIILRDLRQIEKLQEKLRRSEHLAKLGQMAAGIAHEIRNPLSSIKGFTRYFKKQFPADSEQDKYTTAMMNEVDRLNRVIEDMLSFAKPIKLNLVDNSIPEVIDHSLTLVRSDLGSKGIRVEKLVDPSLPALKIDLGMLTQALLNLYLNAIEAMESGGLLTVTARVENGTVELGISDDGCGIGSEDLEKIFDPFFSTKGEGTGLGLSIVHRIIENHGGEIAVKSEKNRGSTFTIKLPLSG